MSVLLGFPREFRKLIERSAEHVTVGHPDRLCDRIGAALVDEALRSGNRGNRAAFETTGGHKFAFVTGECKLELPPIELEAMIKRTVREQYRRIAWDRLEGVIVKVVVQSPDIAQGVDTGGAGDQGCMNGFATDETPEMMPREFQIARQLSDRMYQVVMERRLMPWAHADGKTQIVLQNDKVVKVVIAIQHESTVTREQIIADLLEHVIRPCDITEVLANEDLIVNGTGLFVQGSWDADAGTTGRKLAVNNFGPLSPIGGGAYHGKDPTKVDLSAALMARHISKTIVAHQIGGAREAFVHLSYVIGQAQPTGVMAITDNQQDLSRWVRDHFDLRPQAIIGYLNLWRPIYAQTAELGHYGFDHLNPANAKLLESFTWEKPADI